MSQWTHITGLILIDSMMTWKQLHKKLSTIWGFDTEGSTDPSIPAGSEGSVAFTINKARECGGSFGCGKEEIYHGAQIAIFGDLRDYDNAKELIDWIKAKTTEPPGILWHIREGIVMIHVEYQKTEVWMFKDDIWTQIWEEADK